MATSTKDERKCFYAKSRKEWRKWLMKNHQSEKFVWLIIHHKESKTPSVYYNEAVEEALCFGWIDSKGNKRDSESFYLFFAQRNPKSNWSKLNKERVEKMTAQGLMTASGQKLIDLAKMNGTWTAMEEIDNLVIPADLKKMFARNKKASKNFEAFSTSSKKIILNWILTAKRAETREQRIKQAVELATKNIKANHYRQ